MKQNHQWGRRRVPSCCCCPHKVDQFLSLQATRATNAIVAAVEPRITVTLCPWRIIQRKWRTLLWKMVVLSTMRAAPLKRRRKTSSAATYEVARILIRVLWKSRLVQRVLKPDARMIVFSITFWILLDIFTCLQCPRIPTDDQRLSLCGHLWVLWWSTCVENVFY